MWFGVVMNTGRGPYLVVVDVGNYVCVVLMLTLSYGDLYVNTSFTTMLGRPTLSCRGLDLRIGTTQYGIMSTVHCFSFYIFL